MPQKELLMRRKNFARTVRILILILIVGGIAFWFRSSFWQVKKINCQINEAACSDKIMADLMRFSLGKNIFLLSSQKLSLQIKEDYPQIEGVRIQKKLPSEIGFYLKTRQARLAVKGDRFYLIDQDGFVVEEKDSPGNYPLIFWELASPIKAGSQFSQPEILKTIAIVIDLELKLLEPKTAKIVSADQVEIWLKDNVLAVFSLKKERPLQLDSLQLILSRAKIEGSQVKRVDLRFDKPIVTSD